MQDERLSPSLGWPYGAGPIAAVVDTKGRVLAGAPGTPFAVGKPLADQLPPEDALWVKTVVGNLSEQSTIGRRNPDGSVIAAGPIRDWNSNNGDSSKRLGLLVIRVNGTVMRDQFAAAVAAIVLGTIPVMLVLGGLTGLVFGQFAARPFIRRLRMLSATADAWGQGDLTAAVPEKEKRAGDEIGELGRHLTEMAEELRRHIRAQQKLASLEERNRLARDLHDTVKQQAFAAAMQLGAARTVLGGSAEPAAVFVAQAEALTNKMQEDLMAILHELRPAESDPHGAGGEGRADLSNRLREEVLEWSQFSRIPADVRAGERLYVPEDVCQALLRIAQEALANAARHSRASRVQVELNQANGVLELMVSDDGEGFDPLFTPRGMGLYSMRDRALSLPQGHFRLDTSPGAGVTIRVSCADVGREAGERNA